MRVYHLLAFLGSLLTMTAGCRLETISKVPHQELTVEAPPSFASTKTKRVASPVQQRSALPGREVASEDLVLCEYDLAPPSAEPAARFDPQPLLRSKSDVAVATIQVPESTFDLTLYACVGQEKFPVWFERRLSAEAPMRIRLEAHDFWTAKAEWLMASGGDLREVQALLEQAMSSSRTPRVYRDLATLLEATGDREASLAARRTAVDLARGRVDVLSIRSSTRTSPGLALLLSEYAEALGSGGAANDVRAQALARWDVLLRNLALETVPDDVLERGMVAHAVGRDGPARHDFEAVVRSGSARACLRLIQYLLVHGRSGDLEVAVRAYGETALQKSPEAPYAQIALAAMAQRLRMGVPPVVRVELEAIRRCSAPSRPLPATPPADAAEVPSLAEAPCDWIVAGDAGAAIDSKVEEITRDRIRWRSTLVLMYLGLVPPERLLVPGLAPSERARVHFYAGVRALTQRDREGARSHFRNAVATRAVGIAELRMASAGLRFLDSLGAPP